MRIDAKNNFDAGFIYAWLKSPMGQQMISAQTYGSVIVHINPEHLASLPIPDALEDFQAQKFFPSS